MAEEKKSWVRLPMAALQDERLAKSDVTVLAMMIDILDNKPSAEISIARLMSCTGCSRRTISYALKKLVECGYIASKRTGRASEYSITQEVLPPKKRNTQKQFNKKELKEFDKDGLEHIEDYERFLNAY